MNRKSERIIEVSTEKEANFKIFSLEEVKNYNN